MNTSRSAQGGNAFDFPTQAPSAIAMPSKGDKKISKGGNPPMQKGPQPAANIHNFGHNLAGLFPSKQPQKQVHDKKLQPQNSHNLPKTHLTNHKDQPGREGIPASWVKQK